MKFISITFFTPMPSVNLLKTMMTERNFSTIFFVLVQIFLRTFLNCKYKIISQKLKYGARTLTQNVFSRRICLVTHQRYQPSMYYKKKLWHQKRCWNWRKKNWKILWSFSQHLLASALLTSESLGKDEKREKKKRVLGIGWREHV